jgi:hypothetical protein
VFVILSVLVMLWLGSWQLHRAESGNSLSWAYTFEWPLFAIFAVYFWVKTIRDEADLAGRAEPSDVFALPGGGAEAAGEREELAPDNAYLARLSKEVSGHGRWHGLR